MTGWAVGQARRADVADLARLLWLHASSEERDTQDADAFAVDLDTWWSQHLHTHLPFVARVDGSGVVGMAWLAIVPRVPRPGTTVRRSADVQSVYVLPQHRGTGIGSALVTAAADHARQFGSAPVIVHSGRTAVPLYERLGFASSRQLLQLQEPRCRHERTT